MRALLGDTWHEGLLDYHRPPGDYRIDVSAWRTLAPVRGLYFIPPLSPRLLGSYLREVGPPAAARKVLSRLAERSRNEKHVSCGLGRIVTAADDATRYETGDRVAFLAPNHPACVDRLTLPEAFLAPAPDLPLPEAPDWLLHVAAGTEPPWEEWGLVAGWSQHSGSAPPEAAGDALEAAVSVLARTDWNAGTWLRRSTAAPAAEIAAARPRRRGRRTAVLFGYGQYAKTSVLPNVERWLSVERVHELDPVQVPRRRGPHRAWDTAPSLRADERFDVCLIAGYHHTHAPLAVEALERGAAAVIEKPVVTDESQLDLLLAAMSTTGRPVYAGFQRRYLPFNDLAREDLEAAPGEPISYHCIVYEVPLPDLHWYRWPSSRSRLVSNGCHWVDHFLYLNDFSGVASSRAAIASDGSFDVSLELENGAAFTMVLTDRGSPRIGMQDHVELRSARGCVRIVNSSRYAGERGSGAVRRRRSRPAAAYRHMYRSIGQDIARGGPGDSVRSLSVSVRAMLRLEADVRDLAGLS